MFSILLETSSNVSEFVAPLLEGFNSTLSNFKDIVVIAIQYGFPLIGIFIALKVGINIFKIVSGDEGYKHDLDAANANTDEFLSEYDDWIDNRPIY